MRSPCLDRGISLGPSPRRIITSWRWLGTALTVIALLAGPSAAANTCLGTASSVREWLLNSFLINRTRLGKPSIAGDRFNIWTVSRLGRARTSASALATSAEQQINDSLQRYSKLGFSVSKPFDVFLELEPGILSLVRAAWSPFAVGPYFQSWRAPTSALATSSEDSVAVQYPSVACNIKYWFKSGQHDGLLFTWQENRNSIQEPGAVAHEVGHLTEVRGCAHYGPIWIEARANILAFLITGLTEVHGAEADLTEVFKIFGISPRAQDKTLVNSLKSPYVGSVKDILPFTSAAHFNSDLIAGLLYRMDQKFGDAPVVDFIRFMDGRKGKNGISEIVVPLTRKDRALQVIRAQLVVFRSEIEEWSRLRHDSALQNWLDQELLATGLTALAFEKQ